MIVNVVLQPVTSDVVTWLPSDTKELYNKNLQIPEKRKLLEEFNWIDAHIEYSFNSKGFRSQEFVSETPAVAVFGCSHTQGIGIPYHQVWHQILGQKINKPVFNFGIGGCSADTCYRLAEHYLPNLNVDTVILLEPSIYRLEYWDCNDSFPWFFNVNSVPETHKFFTPWFMDSRNATIHSTKNVQSIAYICQLLGIDFYHCSVTQLMATINSEKVPKIVFARDLLHLGEPHHAALADQIYNDIDFKRVYHPHWLNRAQPPRA